MEGVRGGAKEGLEDQRRKKVKGEREFKGEKEFKGKTFLTDVRNVTDRRKDINMKTMNK